MTAPVWGLRPRTFLALSVPQQSCQGCNTDSKRAKSVWSGNSGFRYTWTCLIFDSRAECESKIKVSFCTALLLRSIPSFRMHCQCSIVHCKDGGYALDWGQLPGPKGCRNQVRPALPGVLASGRVGLKALMVFTSALLSPAVGISSTGMTVHWSSRPSDVITSV